MSDISDILKEAKPLYFARKRRNRQILMMLPFAVCFTAAGAFYVNEDINRRAEETNALYASLYDSGRFEEMFSAVGGVIEEMGLPVDNFGLLATR